MKKILILLILLFCVSSVEAKNIDEYEESLINISQNNNVLGISVTIFKDGEILDTYNYGYTDIDKTTEVDDDTCFRIASTSKMISNMLIMKMVQDGLINLSDSVKLKTGLNYDQDVKLWHILTHTSGYGDSTLFNENMDNVLDINELIMASCRGYTPGTTYEYSNFVSGTVSAIVERLSNTKFNDYAKENLFDIYDLNASYYVEDLKEGTIVAKMYSGIEYDPNTWMYNGEFYDQFELGNQYRLSYGSLYISSKDLAKLGIILCDGSYDGIKYFDQTTLELIRYPRYKTDVYDMALNTDIFKGNMVNGRTIYGHNGQAYSALSSLLYDPSDRSGVAITTNHSSINKTDGIYTLIKDVAQLTYDTYFNEER